MYTSFVFFFILSLTVAVERMAGETQIKFAFHTTPPFHGTVQMSIIRVFTADVAKIPRIIITTTVTGSNTKMTALASWWGGTGTSHA